MSTMPPINAAPSIGDNAARKDAVFQASIDFIGKLTGMVPPPIEVAPPEVFAPFRAFTEKVCALFESAPLAQPAQADNPIVLQLALETIQENHQHHQDHDDHDGYPGSDMEAMNLAAIAALQSARSGQASALLREARDTIDSPPGYPTGADLCDRIDHHLGGQDGGDAGGEFIERARKQGRASAAAVQTLERMGYTYHGAELWKPPLGAQPAAVSAEGVTPEMEEAGAHAFLKYGGEAMTDLQARMVFKAMSAAAPAATVPTGYKLVLVEDGPPGDEPDWDDVQHQAEAAIGIKVEQHTFSIIKREVRRWLDQRANYPADTVQASPSWARCSRIELPEGYAIDGDAMLRGTLRFIKHPSMDGIAGVAEAAMVQADRQVVGDAQKAARYDLVRESVIGFETNPPSVVIKWPQGVSFMFKDVDASIDAALAAQGGQQP